MSDEPNLAEHVEQHLAGYDRAEDEFEFGLDLILDRLAEIRAGRPPERVRATTTGGPDPNQPRIRPRGSAPAA